MTPQQDDHTRCVVGHEGVFFLEWEDAACFLICTYLSINKLGVDRQAWIVHWLRAVSLVHSLSLAFLFSSKAFLICSRDRFNFPNPL